MRYGKTKHSKPRNSDSPKRNNKKFSVSVEIYPLPNRLCQFSVVPRNNCRYEFFRLAIIDHLQNHMIVLSTPLTLNNKRLPPDSTGSKGLIKLERLRDTYFFVSRTGHPLDVKTLMNALKHLGQILQNATGLIERKTMNLYRQPTWVQLLADLLSCSIRNFISTETKLHL